MILVYLNIYFYTRSLMSYLCLKNKDCTLVCRNIQRKNANSGEMLIELSYSWFFTKIVIAMYWYFYGVRCLGDVIEKIICLKLRSHVDW